MGRTYLARDQLKRFWLVRDYIREDELGPDEVCDECGSRSNIGGLYQYGRQYDGGRLELITGRFCGKPCMDSHWS